MWNSFRPTQPINEFSDDETLSNTTREEGLECPICWESFNIVENVPYVLWCGHTLCKNCTLGLRWAVVKISNLPIQLPLFVSCPWCNALSFRFVYKGNLKFPRKNFFLLWMVESMNKPSSSPCSNGNNPSPWPMHSTMDSSLTLVPNSSDVWRTERNVGRERGHCSSVRKSLIFLMNLTAKFPLVVVFLVIVLYVVPASAAILALYAIVTVVFAFPSFLILYFAYPSLDWLVREIAT